MSKHVLIATLELNTGLKVRLSKTESAWLVTRWSRTNNQWIPLETFDDLESAVACFDDQVYETAALLVSNGTDSKDGP